MALRSLRPAMLVAGLAIVLPLRGQGDPPPAERKKESALPEGAKVRLGVGAPFRFMPSVALLPPDYKTLLVPDRDEGLHRIDLAAWRGSDRTPVLTGGQLVVSADGKRFIIHRTGKFTVRDVETGKSIAEIEPPRGISTVIISNAPTVSLSGDGTRLAQAGQSSMSAMGHAVVHDVEKNEITFQAPMQYAGPVVVVMSLDGKLLATRRYRQGYAGNVKDDPKTGRSVQVWEVDGGKELFTALASSATAAVQSFTFSADGKLLALSGGDGPVDVWDVTAKKHKLTVLGRTRQGMQLAISPGSKTLAAVASDGTIQRWSAADGKLIGTTEWPTTVPPSAVLGIAFTDEERVVAWGTVGQSPVAWEAPSGKALSPVPMHAGPIRSIAFASGGKEIVTGGSEGRIVRWDAATGRTVGEYQLRGPRGGFGVPGSLRNIAGLSPDGTLVMTSGPPGAIYDLATGTEILAVPGGPSTGGFTMTVPSPDLKTAYCLTSTFDRARTGTCVVWDLVGQKRLGEVEIPPSNTAAAAAALSPSGERLVVAVYSTGTGGNPTPAMVITGWELKSGKKLGTVEDVKMTGQIQIAAASESTAIIASTQGKARLIDYETGKFGDEIETPQNSSYAPTPIDFSPDRKRFAMGVGLEEPGTFGVRIHEWPSAKPLHTFKGHAGMVSALRFSADGKLLASGSYDGTVLVWDMAAAKVKD